MVYTFRVAFYVPRTQHMMGDEHMPTKTKPKPTDVDHYPVVNLPLDEVEPDPRQPRQCDWNSQPMQDYLMELAHSIYDIGLQQAIIVREMGPQHYRIIAGECRWRASMKARGLWGNPTVIPARIRNDLSDAEACIIALEENDMRRNMSMLDTARAYQRVQEEFALATAVQVAAKIHRDPTHVDRLLKLLQLDKADQMRFDKKALPITVLSSYHELTPQNRKAVIDHIDRHNLTPSQAAVAIKAKLNAQMQVNMFPDLEDGPAPVHKGHLVKLDEAIARMSDAMGFFTNSRNPNETLTTAFAAIGADWRKYQTILAEMERWSRQVNNEMTLYCETRAAMCQQS